MLSLSKHERLPHDTYWASIPKSRSPSTSSGRTAFWNVQLRFLGLSGLMSPKGTTGQIIQAWKDNRLTLLICEAQ